MAQADQLKSQLNKLDGFIRENIKEEEPGTATNFLNKLDYYEEFKPPIVQKTEKPPEEKPVIPPVKKQTEQAPIAQQQKVPLPKPQVAPPLPLPKKPVVKQPTFFERHPDIEKFIGERLITFIGIGILVIGIAFFVKYAIDQDWINEIGRTAIGILCGGVLIALAHRFRKDYHAFSSVLVGGGIAVLYFVIAYSFQVYHLFSQPVAFGLLALITGCTVVLSLSYNRVELAIVAVVGGLASPLMVATGSGNFIFLCSYILILILGMLTLAFFKRWNLVNMVTYGLTVILFGAALNNELGKAAPNYIPAFAFASAFYLVFFLMNIVYNIKNKTTFRVFEIIALLSNTFFYYAGGYIILEQIGAKDFHGLFTILVAGLNAVFAFYLFKRGNVDKMVIYLLIGLALTFISLAAPIQLEGNYITLFWAAEAVLLFWFYQKSKLQIPLYASLGVNVLAIISLFMDWNKIYFWTFDQGPITILFNKGFITAAFSASSLLFSAFLVKREIGVEKKNGWLINREYQTTLSIAGLAVFYIGGLLELRHQLLLHSFTSDAIVIFTSTYNILYLFSVVFISKNHPSEMFRTLKLVAISLFGIAYVVGIQQAVINARDNYLSLDSHSNIYAFYFHYVNIAALVTLLFFAYRNLLNGIEMDKIIKKNIRAIYLWFLCFVCIFVISAELDHLLVLARQPFNQEMYLVFNGVQDITKNSHKIGFPILWGACSFIMITIGMKRKNKQLRIIALTLFAITVIKLISLGFYGESQAGKIVAFISSGVLLLVVSFMYQKLKKLLIENEVPANPENEK